MKGLLVEQSKENYPDQVLGKQKRRILSEENVIGCNIIFNEISEVKARVVSSKMTPRVS